jgi:hypothetical protein
MYADLYRGRLYEIRCRATQFGRLWISSICAIYVSIAWTRVGEQFAGPSRHRSWYSDVAAAVEVWRDTEYRRYSGSKAANEFDGRTTLRNPNLHSSQFVTNRSFSFG